MHEDIDWNRVSERLVCPICGEKSHIAPGSDGYEGTHSGHTFTVSREMARKLSLPDKEEAEAEIARLRAQIARLQTQIARLD